LILNVSLPAALSTTDGNGALAEKDYDAAGRITAMRNLNREGLVAATPARTVKEYAMTGACFPPLRCNPRVNALLAHCASLLAVLCLGWWCTTPAEATASLTQRPFTLTAALDSQASLELEVTAPATIRLAANWTTGPGRLALILNGPGRTGAYARKDGGSVLKLEYTVTAEDVSRGRTWTASIHNFSGRGPAYGTLKTIAVTGPPFTYDFLGDYPRNREPGWSSDCQGLAHDAGNWFVTQMARIWKFPVTEDLNRDAPRADPARGIVTAALPRHLRDLGYDHFGDPDCQGNHLLVPLEQSGERRFPRIVVFDTSTLSYVTDTEIESTQGKHAPWCAVNPFDHRLYSSDFYDVSQLHGYAFEFREGRLLLGASRRFDLLDEFGQRTSVNHVQGGAFSAVSGLVYLVSDTGSSSGGILVFDARSGVKVGRIYIRYSFGSPNYQELEGFDIWDLDAGRAPSIRGQLHTVMIENDIASADDLWIKHHRVPMERALARPAPVLQPMRLPPAGSADAD